MNVSRIALVAIVAALVAGEIVKPTTFHAKRFGNATTFDRLELDDLPPITMPAMGNIDATGVVLAGTTRSLRLAGWCADPISREPGAGLLAIVDGRRRIDVSSEYGASRPDVAAYYASPALAATGFDVDLTGAALGPGVHAIRLAVVTSDRNAIAVFPTVVRTRVGRGAAPQITAP